METLQFSYSTAPLLLPAVGQQAGGQRPPAALCGVVGSGNLEILMLPGEEAERCRVTVRTSARGFGTIWEQVLADFVRRYPAGGTCIEINDMGATPAVVSLRLGQVLQEYRSGGEAGVDGEGRAGRGVPADVMQGGAA